jgi:hypothetical protein
MTLESTLELKEEKRIGRFQKLQTEINEHPLKAVAKYLLIPGYMAKLALSAPLNWKNGKTVHNAGIAFEAIRDAGYVALVYKAFENLTR